MSLTMPVAGAIIPAAGIPPAGDDQWQKTR